jgi:hypothetical protein
VAAVTVPRELDRDLARRFGRKVKRGGALELSGRPETLHSSGPIAHAIHGQDGAPREHNTSRSPARPTAVPAHLDRTGAAA